MKKLILSAALLAGMTFVACSSDDDKGGNNDGCQTCEISAGGETMEEEVCEGENGNATIDGEDTGIDYGQYIDIFEDAGGNCS